MIYLSWERRVAKSEWVIGTSKWGSAEQLRYHNRQRVTSPRRPREEVYKAGDYEKEFLWLRLKQSNPNHEIDHAALLSGGSNLEDWDALSVYRSRRRTYTRIAAYPGRVDSVVPSSTRHDKWSGCFCKYLCIDFWELFRHDHKCYGD